MTGHRVVLRPRSFLETGDLAFAFMRHHWRLFAFLLVWTIPASIGASLLHLVLGWDADLALGVDVLLTSLLGGVWTLLCGDLMLDPKVSLRALQRRFIGLLPGFIVKKVAGWILLAVTFGLGFRLTAFFPESVLLERGKLSAAVSRSNALLRATPGRALGLGVVTLVILGLGAFAMEMARMALRELFGMPGPLSPDFDHATWAEFVGIALVQPYVAALRFLLYIDCRTRREGWDLQVQFNALVVAAQSPLRSAPSEAA
jgi:hypothetical protein